MVTSYSGERARRSRPKPLAYALLALVVLLVFLLIRAATGRSDYPELARSLATEDSKLGSDVGRLTERIDSLDRLELIRTLKTWSKTASANLDTASKLEPPEDFRVPNGYLIAALGLRSESLKNYEPAIQNALSDRDIQVASSQLETIMIDLASADRSFDLFRSSWPVQGAKPTESRWVGSPGEVSRSVSAFVRRLRNLPALETTFNLKVVSVTVSPKATGSEGDVAILPASQTLTVTAVVSNEGNQSVPATLIAAILKSEADPRPQTVESRVGTLGPGKKQSITITGLKPTSGGAINLLTVTAGPVGGERNTLDNSLELKFKMPKQ